MEVKVFDQKWKESGTITLNDAVFGLEMNQGLVHRALMLQLANARKNLAHTKTRGERAGSTRKLFRQKGTGRARMGANRSPVRRGGGVVFGPRNNQNFVLEMNKKERQKALFCMLSEKARQEKIVVVKKLDLKEIKTKSMQDVFTKLGVSGTALLALNERNENVEKSARNLAKVKTLSSAYLNVADLLKFESLVLLEDGVKNLNELAA